MQGYIHFNGELITADEKLVGARNRGLRYGDGVFETIRVEQGKIPLISYHLERLIHGLHTLHFELPDHLSLQYITAAMLELGRKNDMEQQARVRLNLFRGNGTDLNIIIESEPLAGNYSSFNENGFVVDIYKDVKKSCDILSNLKSNNYLPYAMAAFHAKANGLNDCLVMNSYDRICDSTIANIFWIKDKQLFTPPLSEGCVAGVMRRYLGEKMLDAGYALEEMICTRQKLLEADEVFLTNALFGIRWVQQLRDSTYSNKLSAQLYKQFVKPLFTF